MRDVGGWCDEGEGDGPEGVEGGREETADEEDEQGDCCCEGGCRGCFCSRWHLICRC